MAYYQRAMRQFGAMIDDIPGNGIGGRIAYTEETSHGFVNPNRFLYEPEKETNVLGECFRLNYVKMAVLCIHSLMVIFNPPKHKNKV